MQLDSLKGIFIRERKVKEGRAETGLWRQVLRKRGKGGRGAEREGAVRTTFYEGMQL